MPNVTGNVAMHLLAEGGLVPVSLLELQLIDGSRHFISDAPVTLVPLLAQFDAFSFNPRYSRPNNNVRGVPGDNAADSQTPVFFHPWLTRPPAWGFTGTLATATSDASFQNVSGDTVNRSHSLLFSTSDMWGALFIYRLWLAAAETALITVIGKVDDATVDGDELDLTLSDIGNWSQIKAPDCTIDVSCGNIFGSPQCGSVSPTPCQNSYGSCTQINRFKGVVTQWSDSVVSIANASGVAQPVPPFSINLQSVI